MELNLPVHIAKAQIQASDGSIPSMRVWPPWQNLIYYALTTDIGLDKVDDLIIKELEQFGAHQEDIRPYHGSIIFPDQLMLSEFVLKWSHS